MGFKRGLATALAVVLCLTMLVGCGEKAAAPFTLTVACAAPKTADPALVTETDNETILLHLYENLMKKTNDTTGVATAAPGIAKSYAEEKLFDGTVTYTFRLRDNVKWSDGTAVTAHDFVYAWRRLVSPATGSPNHALLSMVQGYDAVRAGGELSELQVTAKNDKTLVVKLAYPCPYFIEDICTAAATLPLRAEVEADWDWAQLVTNGAYRVGSWREESDLLLVRCNTGRNLTGPDGIRFYFADTTEEAYALYEAEQVDFVGALPEAQLTELSRRDGWQATPVLSTYTLLFHNQNAPTDNPLVRQALSLAIDRSVLPPLVGVTAQAARGLVPPGIAGGEDGAFRDESDLLTRTPEAYQEGLAKARELLTVAGFGEDDPPELPYLYADSPSARAVAQALCQQWWETLHVRVTPHGVTQTELDAALAAGDFTLAATTLSTPYADPMGFLEPWAGGDSRNVIGYRNSAFDTLLVVIGSASDASARLACLHDAETLLQDDAALAPLYTVGTAWALRETLTGVARDATGHFYFGLVSKKG
ncbi:MAG: peptide ABC transporter substrate-binding protein [Oscillospiraceae bacterium]